MVFSRFRGEDIKPELFSVGLTKLHYDALHPATLKRFALFIQSLANARFLTHRANNPSDCRGFTASQINLALSINVVQNHLGL